MTIDSVEVQQLVDRLAKPIFTLRMARGRADSESLRLRNGAKTSMRKAIQDIDRIVREYVSSVDLIDDILSDDGPESHVFLERTGEPVRLKDNLDGVR